MPAAAILAAAIRVRVEVSHGPVDEVPTGDRLGAEVDEGSGSSVLPCVSRGGVGVDHVHGFRAHGRFEGGIQRRHVGVEATRGDGALPDREEVADVLALDAVGGGERHPVGLVFREEERTLHHRSDVGSAGHRAGGRPRRAQRRQQDADEQGDDRDHHQQLDEREGGRRGRPKAGASEGEAGFLRLPPPEVAGVDGFDERAAGVGGHGRLGEQARNGRNPRAAGGLSGESDRVAEASRPLRVGWGPSAAGLLLPGGRAARAGDACPEGQRPAAASCACGVYCKRRASPSRTGRTRLATRR